MHSINRCSRKYLRIFLATIGICLPATTSQAQDQKPFYIGLGGAVNFNTHSLDIPVYRGSEFCGVFKEGDGVKPSFHGLVEWQPSNWPIWLSPRLTFNNFGGEIAAPAVDNARVRNPIDSSLVPATREHRLTANLPALALDAYAKYKFGEIAYIFGGPNLSFLLSPGADQEEVINSPSGAFFDETGTNTRSTNDGEIPNVSSFQAHFSIGAGADVKLAQQWYLSPEVSYSIPLTNIRSDVPWKVSQLRGGVTIKFNITPEPKPASIVVQNGISGSVQLLGLERAANGSLREFESPIIRVEEFVSRDAHPVLNSVFFDKNTGTIPTRYVRRGTLDTNTMRGSNALQVNHHMLDIVGYRLQTQPAQVLTIKGIQTSDEEAINPRLASDRANAVANYFMSQWSIDPSRFKMSSETRPVSTDPQLAEEQQKVELVSSDPSLFDPFMIQTITRTMNPPGLRVRSTLTSDAPIERSDIAVTQRGGFTLSSPQVEQYDWFASNERELPSTEEPLVATLSASAGNVQFSTTDSSRVEQITIRKKRAERIADLEIERYNLITFEFDKATLDARADHVMDLISAEATNRDTIEVAGYTDLIGEPAYNDRLATERAKSVETALRSELRSSAPSATIASRGEGEVDLYDNSLPEGRQLSRTVRITIKRPIGSEQ